MKPEKKLYRVSSQYCVDEEGFRSYYDDEIEELKKEFKIKIIKIKSEVDESMRNGEVLVASISTITMTDGVVFKYNEGVYTRELSPEIKKYLSEIGKKGGKKGGAATTARKKSASAANLDAARKAGKVGGWKKGVPRKKKTEGENQEAGR